MILHRNHLLTRLLCRILPAWCGLGIYAARVEYDTVTYVRIGRP